MNRENCLDIFERYIKGEASSQEVIELIAFLKNDANLDSWLESQILESSDSIGSNVKMRILDNIRSQAGYSPDTSGEKEHRSHQFNLRWVANIAAILLPFVIVLGAYLYLKPSEVVPFEVIADMGEKANLTLPEGSKVAINSGSKIIYYSDYNKNDRVIKLNGEAFFEVSHDPVKPFIIECEDIKIKVLGTTFGIKAYENEKYVSIVLNSGKIQLITPKEEIIMKPNERILYNKTTQSTSRENVKAEDYTDWKQNRLRFENESLETIMNTVSRMHNIDIIFEDQNLKEQRFTGTVDNTNIESVLDAIRLTSSITYRLKDGIIYLYHKE